MTRKQKHKNPNCIFVNMVFITAEIGINHNGSMESAKKLIDIALSAGCDAVKFQKRDVNKVYSKKVLDSPRDSPWGTTTREQKLGLEFSEKQYGEIDRYCKKKKISWYLSCWDVDSQIQMRKFKTKYNKVASAMLLHTKLLKTIAEERKHTFISTGMSTLKDITKAVKIFKDYECPFELMHSHSAYPMLTHEANLKVIQTLQKKYKCNVGYSGHEFGLTTSIASICLGATIIERHVTLDRTMWGTDQMCSVEPQGLIKLVRGIKELKLAIGDGIKRVTKTEIPIRKKLRK